MARTAIATDSNSGITQSQAKELGVFVLPMPFFMRGKIQFEDGLIAIGGVKINDNVWQSEDKKVMYFWMPTRFLMDGISARHC